MGLHYTVNNSTSKKFWVCFCHFLCTPTSVKKRLTLCDGGVRTRTVAVLVLLFLNQQCDVLYFQSSLVQCTSFELLNLKAKELQLEVEGTTVLQNHRFTINAGEGHLRSVLVGTLGAIFSRSSHVGVAGLLSRSSHAHTSSLFISDGYCSLRGQNI